MPRPYTQINLDDVEDAAPANGFGERWEACVARTALDGGEHGRHYGETDAARRAELPTGLPVDRPRRIRLAGVIPTVGLRAD
jgi:hypothetical protein